jgi:dipeptidase E
MVETAMKLALTSDFPTTANAAVVDAIRGAAADPRIAWIPPLTRQGRERFLVARQHFALHGLDRLEYCDIDEEPDERQLARLVEYDVIYLTGGDPVVFLDRMQQGELPARLQDCVAAGRWIVGASGGSMQVTRNVSLYRLLKLPVSDVVAGRHDFEALGLVDYELLPHLNRLAPSMLEAVRQYSEHLDHDVIGLSDGAALLHEDGEVRCTGVTMRFRSHAGPRRG